MCLPTVVTSINVTALSFFGPTGVSEKARGRGIGLQLLIQSLLEMKHMGYAYAIIGSAGPVDFYKKAVGAIEIPGSEKNCRGNGGNKSQVPNST